MMKIMEKMHLLPAYHKNKKSNLLLYDLFIGLNII